MTWFNWLMTAGAVLNVSIAVANVVVYWKSAKRTRKPYNRLKLMMAGNMIIAILVYLQLEVPGELTPGFEGIMVRFGYTLVLLNILAFGMVGLKGVDRDKQRLD